LFAGLQAQDAKQIATLQNMAVQHRAVEEAEYAKAVNIAKQKGWPIVQNLPNGNTIVLQRIDAFGNPEYLTTMNNTIAAATTRANQLWPGGSSGLNLNGSSSAVSGKLGVWDGGLVLRSHVEFAGGRIFQKDSARTDISLDDHATHTSGTMVASGVNPIAKGMAYGLQKFVAYYGLSNDVSTISTEAPNLLVSNHSYGQIAGWYYTGGSPAYSWYGDTTLSFESYIFGYYGSRAQLYDSILYNAPNYMMVMSAGNSNGNGSGSQGPSVGSTYSYNGSTTRTRTASFTSNPTYGSVAGGQVGKNMITVGAVSGLSTGYNSPSDVQIANFSCWGPTDDGRIKPDIVADGVSVTSTFSTSTTAYGTESGTSMASPNAAGSLLLVQEYYNQKHPGIFMKGATLKALAIHTADEAGAANGPDYQYGYGLLNVLKATSLITSSYNQKTDTIIEKTLTSGTPYTISVVASGNGPLKATIVWIDPKGTVDNVNVFNNATPKLVHDLDLRASTGSSTYYPWILNPSIPSAAATKGDDAVNTVEQVVVDSVVPGKTYTITVSNKGSLQRGTQPFSLIISGIGGTAYCTSAPSSNTGTRIDNVTFAGINKTNPSGCTTYNNYAGNGNTIGQIQTNQTLPISVTLSSCDASSASKIVKVFIDYNNNGVFTDAGELAATSSVITGNGTFSGNITTPLGLTVGNTLLMRIVVSETTDASTVTPCGTYSKGETQDYLLQVIPPNHDLSIISVTKPDNSTCASSSMFVSATLRNLSSTNSETGIPLTAVIKSGSTTIATLTGTFPSLAASGTYVYTFFTPFTANPGTTYTIQVYSGLLLDQNRANDTSTLTITTAARPTAPTAIGEVCGTTTILKVTNPNSTANYLWYTATDATATPIATGTNITTTNTSNNTFYVKTGASLSAGPINKSVYSSGAYRTYATNTIGWLNYTSTVPVTLNAVKLYSKNAGKITMSVADVTLSGSSITGFTEYASQDINIYATSPNPQAGDGTANDVADSGAYYNIQLPLPAGSHSIVMEMDGVASVYRNQSTSVTFPMGTAGLFQLTGVNNSTTSPQTVYPFFYDMKLSTADCPSDYTTVVASVVPTPVISQAGNVLTSNITTGTLQWYNNSTGAISGATGASYTVTSSGTYSLIVTDALGCQKASNSITVTITAVTNASNSEIGLTVSPNPASSQINVGFTTNTKADVSVQLINPMGVSSINNTYSGFVGKFNQQYNVSNLAAGVYVLKVQQGNKVYRQKVLIAR